MTRCLDCGALVKYSFCPGVCRRCHGRRALAYPDVEAYWKPLALPHWEALDCDEDWRARVWETRARKRTLYRITQSDDVALADLRRSGRRSSLPSPGACAPYGLQPCEYMLNYVELKEAIDDQLDSLRSEENMVLRLRYGVGCSDEHTLSEIGEFLQKSPERVRQIISNAMGKLLNPKRSRRLLEFLG